MKTWKLIPAITASALMSMSQLVWAASEIENNRLRELVLSQGQTFLEYANSKPLALDGESQELMQQWLRHFGPEKTPQIQVQRLDGKKSLRFFTNHDGRSYNVTVQDNDTQNIWINGQKVSIDDARNIPTLFAKLAEKDSTLKPLAKALTTAKTQNQTDKMFLSAEQFLKLSDLKKVEYLSLLRQLNEAASSVERVHNHVVEKTTAPGSYFAIESLLQASVAFAESVPPQDGEACIVAGNLSLYEKRVCNQRPKDSTFNKYAPEGNYLRETIKTMMAASDQCPTGTDTACNPLVYGYDQSAAGLQPICLDSKSNPKEFTARATENCNKKSPIYDKGSPERRAAFARILKSYLAKKEGKQNTTDYDSCFNENSEVRAGRCKDLFKPQLEGFKEFYGKSLAICQSMKRADQTNACEELRKRALDLQEFTELEPLPPATDEDQKAACLKAGATWNDTTKTCWCNFTEKAIENSPRGGTNVKEYSCTAAVKGGAADFKDLPPAKDKCTKDDGSKSLAPSCSPLLWFGIFAAGLIAWNLTRKKSTPTPLTPLPSEGGSGSGSAGSGGTRPPPATVPTAR